MQVKKFEAKSMKEALQLVKQELGPDAVILGVRDNKKSFGLAGRGSIELTAAVSEKSLLEKKYVENRLPGNSKDQFRNTTARHQKAFIETTVNRYRQRQQEESQIRPSKVKRYIDIRDEDGFEAQVAGQTVDRLLHELAAPGTPVLEDAANLKRGAPVHYAAPQAPSEDVISLRQEVATLRELLAKVSFSEPKGPVTRHPGAEYNLPFELSYSFEKLQSAGVDVRFIVEILTEADRELSPLEKKKRHLVDAWVARYIMSHTTVKNEWEQRIHAFVGPSGHGKTLSVVKWASQLVMQEKKRIAILSADTHKVGGADQLKIYAQILNVPFETIKHSIEITHFVQKYWDYDYILIDYPGFALKDMAEIDQMRTLLPHRDLNPVVHLVLSCTCRDADAYDICHRYQATGFKDFVVTRLDECSCHGLLYNLQRKTEKPLAFFGVGSRVPEDFEPATRERVLDLLYKLTKSDFKEKPDGSHD